MDWKQMGDDFQQKYESTYCRYTSPVSGVKELFFITAVQPSNREAPSLILYNSKHGELYLKYDTEAELDFTFPDVGYFSHNGKAMLFSKLYQRQWKKGLCSATAMIIFPYPNVAGEPTITEEYLSSAFTPAPVKSFDEAIKELNKETFSIPVNKSLAVGPSEIKGKWWVWFESEPVAELLGNEIQMKVPQFRQEIYDHCRLTGDYARYFGQAT